MLFKKKKDIVGIDIGSYAVKLIRLREHKGGYQLQNMGMERLPSEAIVDNAIMDSTAVVDAIRTLLEEQKVKAKGVATSVSGHSVIIRKIQVPTMTEEELETSIQFEAEQYIPFEISEVNLDFQIVGTDEKDPSQMNVILVAAKKDHVSDQVAVLSECGLNPVVMDIDCFAVENAFEVSYGASEETLVALINLGASAINVNIVRNGSAVFTRDIQIGGNLVVEELQKRAGLDREEAEQIAISSESGSDPDLVQEILQDSLESLCQEVQRSLDFFAATSADERVQQVYVTGGVSLMVGLCEALSARLELPVEKLDPFQGIAVDSKSFDPEELKGVGPLFSVAIGLAMRRVGDK
ncbi:MAG: pilus assembly protein PilM [Desulfuromonas sp.]|nr:MAG: pilus assembly protein PilM [Desulfuromonas sp.]